MHDVFSVALPIYFDFLRYMAVWVASVLGAAILKGIDEQKQSKSAKK
ncbi:MAG: hypothetical protein RSD76_06520 [Clostridia bacterium]